MPLDLPDLWGDDIKVDVLPPLVILKAQDEAIRRKTQGILHSEVSQSEEVNGPVTRLVYALDLVAAAIGYRETILTVYHTQGKLYPVTIRLSEGITWPRVATQSPIITCATSDEFVEGLRAALQPPPTKSAIASLLDMSNEVRMKN